MISSWFVSAVYGLSITAVDQYEDSQKIDSRLNSQLIRIAVWLLDHIQILLRWL